MSRIGTTWRPQQSSAAFISRDPLASRTSVRFLPLRSSPAWENRTTCLLQASFVVWSARILPSIIWSLPGLRDVCWVQVARRRWIPLHSSCSSSEWTNIDPWTGRMQPTPAADVTYLYSSLVCVLWHKSLAPVNSQIRILVFAVLITIQNLLTTKLVWVSSLYLYILAAFHREAAVCAP